MYISRIVIVSTGETKEKALKNLQADVEEISRQTGVGGEADISDCATTTNEKDVNK